MKVCPVCNDIVSERQRCSLSTCPNQGSVAPAVRAAKIIPGPTGQSDRVIQAGLDRAGDVARGATRRAAFAVTVVFLVVVAIAVIGFNVWGGTDSAGSVTVMVSGDANVRSAPTAEGSTVLETLAPGTQLTGRWVDGSTNPSERWFEINNSGKFIWAGNLSSGALASTSVKNTSPQVLESQEVWVCDFGNPEGPFTVKFSAASYEFVPYNPDGGQLQGPLRILGDQDQYGSSITGLELVGSGAPDGRWGFIKDRGKRKALLSYAVETSGDGSECTPPGQEPQYVFN